MKPIEKKILLSILCSNVLLHADVIYNLKQKQGSSIPYLLSEKEVAIPKASKTSTFLPSTSKEIFRNDSYRLFSTENKSLSLNQGTKTKKGGQVFYKYGQKDEDHRYISTGSILVTFNPTASIDIEEFARENKLKIIKTITSNKKGKIILFNNVSNKNDIEISSNLNKKENIIFAKPNWILPIKLF